MGNGYPTIFRRQTTGLVRQLSLFDSFVFNASFVNVGLAVLYMVLYVPGWHPGGSMILATLGAMIIAIPTSLVYGILASVYPRSGGEYVYISRILGPTLGVAAVWNLGVWGVFYIGVPCGLFARYGLAPLFRFVGTAYHEPGWIRVATWLNSGLGTFMAGGLVLIAVILLYIRGTRTWAKVQNILFAFGLMAILLSIVVLVMSDSLEVSDRLAQYFTRTGTAKDFLAAVSAKTAEYGGGSAPFSLFMTFLVLSWPCYNLFWCNASTYFGGEVRQPTRSQMLSLPGSVIFSGIIITVLVGLTQSVFGFNTLAVLGRIQPQQLGLSFTPTFNELLAIISPTKWIGMVILIGFLYWCVAWTPVTIGVVTRALLACSLDQLVPTKFSEVHPRLHTPVFGLSICGTLGLLSLALYAFIPTFALLVGVFGIFLTFILASIAGSLLPFRKRTLFEASSAAWRWGKIPVATLVGALSVALLTVAEISIVLDPVSGISLSPTYDPGSGAGGPFYMFILNILVFGLGFVIYPLIRSVQRRRGIDVDLSFKEIPPE